MEGQSKKAYRLKDIKNHLEFFGSIENILEFHGISKSSPSYHTFKKFVEGIEGITDEEIKNHYNVNVYQVLPNPPDKKESLLK
jgi:hypothetical protein